MYMEEETWCTLWADSPYHTYLPSKIYEPTLLFMV